MSEQEFISNEGLEGTKFQTEFGVKGKNMKLEGEGSMSREGQQNPHTPESEMSHRIFISAAEAIEAAARMAENRWLHMSCAVGALPPSLPPSIYLSVERTSNGKQGRCQSSFLESTRVGFSDIPLFPYVVSR